jgi:hypothetical protein
MRRRRDFYRLGCQHPDGEGTTSETNSKKKKEVEGRRSGICTTSAANLMREEKNNDKHLGFYFVKQRKEESQLTKK